MNELKNKAREMTQSARQVAESIQFWQRQPDNPEIINNCLPEVQHIIMVGEELVNDLQSTCPATVSPTRRVLEPAE